MKVKYKEIPTYEEVELVGKSFDTIAGTIDRKPVGRALITEQAGFEGKHEVVAEGADGTPIRSVEKINEDGDGIELVVEFVGGIRSLATKKVYKGWTAKNIENKDVVDVFVTDTDAIDAVKRIARRMDEQHPECDSQWQILDKATGKRVFLRLVDTDIKANGKRANC